jgi:hypothetical protein
VRTQGMSPQEVETAPVRGGLTDADAIVPRHAFQLADKPFEAPAYDEATPCSRFARCSPLP